MTHKNIALDVKSIILDFRIALAAMLDNSTFKFLIFLVILLKLMECRWNFEKNGTVVDDDGNESVYSSD